MNNDSNSFTRLKPAIFEAWQQRPYIFITSVDLIKIATCELTSYSINEVRTFQVKVKVFVRYATRARHTTQGPTVQQE